MGLIPKIIQYSYLELKPETSHWKLFKSCYCDDDETTSVVAQMTEWLNVKSRNMSVCDSPSTASCCFLAAATAAFMNIFSSVCVLFFSLRCCVLPLHPHGCVEEPDRCPVHATDGPHGGQLQGPGLHPGSRGGQRAEPEGERHHLSEFRRPTQSCCAQLRPGWVTHAPRVPVLSLWRMRNIARLCREWSVGLPGNTDRGLGSEW